MIVGQADERDIAREQRSDIDLLKAVQQHRTDGVDQKGCQEQGGRQPPDLTDDQWDHGSSAGDIFFVIKRGLPQTMMPGFDGRIPDEDIWNIVNYLRTLRPRK